MDMPSTDPSVRYKNGQSDMKTGSTARPWYRSRRAAYGVLVVLPALAVLLYTSLFASAEYETRAEFLVKGMEADPAPIGGIAELVGAGAAMGGVQREALSVRDYLLSLDAMDDLKTRGVDLEDLLHGENADWLTTLYFSDRRAEGLREYFRAMVDVDYDSTEGITRLTATAYSPEQAQNLALALIELGEERVNSFNLRAIAAGEELAREELATAELELAEIQAKLTDFRDLSGELDPAISGKAAQTELEIVEAELIMERANLASMRRSLASSSPLVAAAQSRVSTLQSAADQMQSKLTGASDALAGRLSNFEQLTLQREFAAKHYEAAQIQLLEAQSQTARQRLFLVPVVDPNLPEKPVGPRPWRMTMVVFLALNLAFAIGWLLLAGIREHQAD